MTMIKPKELVKDILLVLLIISAGFLVWRTWMYDGKVQEGIVARFFGSEDAGQEGPSGAVILQEAAFPVRAAITDGEGRMGAQYSREGVAALYVQVKPFFADVLSAAGSPEPSDREEWERALGLPGFYLDFWSDIPLGPLASWLGVRLSPELESLSARAFAFSWTEEASALFLMDSAGNLLRCALSPRPFTMFTENINNGCIFAFEREDGPFPGLDRDTMLFPKGDSSAATRPTVAAGLAADTEERINLILVILGFNPMTNYRYNEGDGTRVIVDGQRSVRVRAGRIYYRDTSDGGDAGSIYVSAADGLNAGVMIERARELAQLTAGSLCGDAQLTLTGFTDGGAGAYTVRFSYLCGGIPVVLTDPGDAASITVRDGLVTSAVFNLRAFTIGEMIVLTPMEQAAAALASDYPGSQLCIIYADKGDYGAEILPQWAGR